MLSSDLPGLPSRAGSCWSRLVRGMTAHIVSHVMMPGVQQAEESGHTGPPLVAAARGEAPPPVPRPLLDVMHSQRGTLSGQLVWPTD